MTLQADSASRRVTIVGAGLAGSLAAIHLARRGWQVAVYDKRDDLRLADGGGFSMNLGLSQRGIHALTEVGVVDQVMKLAVPMRGRVIHGLDGRLAFQAYGRESRQVIYAIKRNDLNLVLLRLAESFGNVELHFNQRCVGLDRATATVEIQDVHTGWTVSVPADVVVGADGIFSAVRQAMQRGVRADYSQEYLDWGWKELTIPTGPGGAPVFESRVLHLWPRGSCTLLAHPNLDGSFCCSLLLPLEGEPGFSSLRTEAEVLRFFAALFGDIVPHVPALARDFLRNPTVNLVSIRTAPWHSGGKVVLLGDACHAVFPFLAQGMNAAFESCSLLVHCIDRHPEDLGNAFAEYQARRKPDADALAEMAYQHFVDLRETSRSLRLRIRKRVDDVLSHVLPRFWMPLHSIVTHTRIPYAEVLRRSRAQGRLLRWGGIIIALVALLLAIGAVR